MTYGPDIFLISSMRNECPYIVEFVAHYQNLGFGRNIVIATNNNTDRSTDLLQRLERIGAISLVMNEVPRGGQPQSEAYKKIARLIRNRSKRFVVYTADADEFLFLYRHRSIVDYIDHIGDVDAIALNWKFFGSNGHLTRPRGLVLENYDRHSAPTHRGSRTLKTICHFGDNISGLGIHFPRFKDFSSARFCYSDGERICPENVLQKPHQNWAEVRYDYAAVHHYGLKSREEFDTRRTRGRGNTSVGPPRHTDTYFEQFDQNMITCRTDASWILAVRDEMEALFTAAGLSADYDRSYFGL